MRISGRAYNRAITHIFETGRIIRRKQVGSPVQSDGWFFPALDRGGQLQFLGIPGRRKLCRGEIRIQLNPKRRKIATLYKSLCPWKSRHEGEYQHQGKSVTENIRLPGKRHLVFSVNFLRVWMTTQPSPFHLLPDPGCPSLPITLPSRPFAGHVFGPGVSRFFLYPHG